MATAAPIGTVMGAAMTMRVMAAEIAAPLANPPRKALVVEERLPEISTRRRGLLRA
jgi:hypothetical protein